MEIKETRHLPIPKSDMKKSLPIAGVLVAIIVLCSCQRNSEFYEMRSTDGEWTTASEVFEFTPIDTVQSQNLFIHLRAGEAYPYSNIYVIAKLTTPDGKVLVDTLQYEMATPDGQLLGEGFTDIKESKLLYKKGFVFKEKKPYTIALQQAMRSVKEEKGVRTLNGIYSVGISIENDK